MKNQRAFSRVPLQATIYLLSTSGKIIGPSAVAAIPEDSIPT